MNYHPIMGILIFLLAIIFSFILGRLLLKKSYKENTFKFSKSGVKTKGKMPKGDITSPDAPWLNEK